MHNATTPRHLKRIAQRQAERGVAIVMALTTLFLLLSLAVPFVLTASHHEASAVSFDARTEARLGSESARDFAIHELRRREFLSAMANWRWEQENGVSRDAAWSAARDPFVDTPSEFFVDVPGGIRRDFPFIEDGTRGGREDLQRGVWHGEWTALDPLKRVLSAYVQDEQGKININTAPPALLGNLMGSGIVTRVDVDQGEIDMDPFDAEYFPNDRPGHMVINGVLIRYENRQGAQFYGVQMVAAYDENYMPGAGPMFADDTRYARMILQGISEDNPTLAIPLQAYLIAYYRLIDAANTKTRRYRTIDEVKSISDFALLNVSLETNGEAGGTSTSDRLLAAEWVAMRPFITVSSRGPMNNGFFYPHIVDRVNEIELDSGRTIRLASIKTDDVVNPQWLVRPSPDWFISGDPRYDPQGRSVGRGFSFGTTLRLTYPSTVSAQPYYCMLLGRGRTFGLSTPGAQPPLVTNLGGGRFPFERRPILEVQEITPININTAPLEVIVANLKGLIGLEPADGGDGQQRAMVTTVDAYNIGRAVQHVLYGEGFGSSGNPFGFLNQYLVPSDQRDVTSEQLRFGGLRGDKDFDRLLRILVDEEVISVGVRNAIMGQQYRPYAPRNVMTAPFCYRSYSPVTVDALATTFTSSGVDSARAHIREIIHVGHDIPGDTTTYDWSDWRIMAEDAQRPQGNIITLDAPQRFTQDSERGEREMTSMRLPWLLDPQADAKTNGVKVWNLQDNQSANLNPQPFFANARPADPNAYPPGTPPGLLNRQVGQLQGGSLSFWLKVPAAMGSGSTNAYVFDGGERDGTNRMSLLWWGAGRLGGRLATELPGLVFRLADRTLEPAYIANHIKPERGTFVPGQWYHFDLRWKGLESGHMSMLVDGVGRLGNQASSAVQTDYIVQMGNAWVARSGESGTPLSFDLGHTSDSESFSLQGAGNSVSAAFEPQGALQVGNVPFEYRTLSGSGFADLLVGTGGARNQQEMRDQRGIIQGDPVGIRGPRQIGGQTGGPTIRQLQTADPSVPAGSRVVPFGYTMNVQAHPMAPRAAAGGSSLAYTLRGPGIFRVTGVPDNNSNDDYYAPKHIGPEAGFPHDATFCPLDTVTDLPASGVLYLYGPCWRSYSTVSIAGEDKLVPDLAQEGTTPLQPIDVRNGFSFMDGEFLVFTRAAGGINVVERRDNNFQIKDPADYYHFLGGPNQIGDTSHDDSQEPVTMRGYDPNATPTTVPPFHLTGAVGVLCSFAANGQGDYFDPMQLFPGQNGNAFAFVRVNDEWLPYHRMISVTGGARLFCYTSANRLRGPAAAATVTFRDSLPHVTSEALRLPVFSLLSGFQGNPQMRTQDPTTLAVPNHAVGSRIVPIFFVTGLRAGPNDLVTLLMPPNSNKIERRIVHARRVYADPNNNASGVGQFIALDRETLIAYDPGSQMLKFPSHTMPDGIPTTLKFGGPDPLVADLNDTFTGGQIDELRFEGFPIGDFRVTRDFGPNDTEMYVNQNAQSMPGNVGMVKVDGELIVYRDRTRAGNGYRLSGLTRGVLGTIRAAHAEGVGLLNLTGFPVFVHDDQAGVPFNADEHEIHLLGGEAAPQPFGFLRVEPNSGWDQNSVEIIGYNRTQGNANNSTVFAGSYRPQETQGLQPALFRGVYGTRRRSWDNNAVITQLPVREPDFYPQWMRPLNAPVTRSPGIAFAQGTLMADGARISKLRWYMSDEGQPTEVRDSIQARLVFRFNGAPNWSSSASSSGPLFAYDFNWGKAQVADNTNGAEMMEIDLSMLAPDLVDKLEWRLFLFYKDDAYARGRWKGGVAFRGISAELNTRTKILSHEELR